MKIVRSLTFLALLAGPALASDIVVTKQKHADGAKVRGVDQPAKDSTEVTWIAKDRMRVEEGDRVTIVRTDLKKMYLLDSASKTYKAADLPIDMKKYMPADMAPMMEQMLAQMKITVTPTTETKMVKDWNATKYTLTMTMPMGGSSTQDVWVTKDVGVDLAGWQDMYAAMMSISPFGASMVAEMKKIDGFPVLTERTQNMMGSETRSRETVVSVEQKEPAAGLYDLPAGYTEKPFDPMAEMPMGGPGHRAPRGG